MVSINSIQTKIQGGYNLMLKKFTNFIIMTFLLIVFSITPAFASDVSDKNFKASSAIEKSQNKSDLDFIPKVKSQLTDKEGKVTELNFIADHKLLKVLEENGNKTYLIESTIDVPITASSTGSLDKAGQKDIGKIHQRARLYWDYNIQSDGRTYVKYTKINAYWYRDDNSYNVQSARFSAFIAGTRLDTQGSYINSWHSSSFIPYWKPTSYLETNSYTDTTGSYITWPWVQPLTSFGDSSAGIKGNITYYAQDLGEVYTRVTPL